MTNERGIEIINMNRRKFVKLGTGLVAGLTESTAIGFPAQTRTEDSTAPSRGKGPLRIELNDKFLRLAAGWCELPDWTMGLEVDNELLQTTAANTKLISEEPFQIEFHFPHRQLIWEVKAEADKTTNTIVLHSMIRNESARAAALGKAFLLQTDRLGGFCKPGDEVVYLPMTSGQQLNQVQKLATDSATSDIAIQAYNQSQNKALQVGFVSFQRAKTQVEHVRQATGLQLKVWCEFDGWELAPGAKTPTETLILGVGENPHAQLEAWGDRAALLSNPRPRIWAEEPHGWNGCTWVDAFGAEERYEDFVLRNAKAMRRRLAGFGMDYIWVSIGNLKDFQPGNWLDWNEESFPHGPQYLHDQLENLGIKWGLWCGAFMLSSKIQDKVEEFKEALFKQPDGKQPMVFRADWAFGLDSPNADFGKPIYALDPSHPKTLEFLRKVFETYREWGVRYYMVDFLRAGADTLSPTPHAKHFDKTLVSGPEVLLKGLRVIREACGDDTHLLASSGPTIHTAGIMDAVRTGNDFCEGRPLIHRYDTYPGTFGINSAAFWTGPILALSNQAASYYTHRKLYVNNSGNMLAVDKPLALNQAQVFATIHALSGGPTILGDDMEIIDEERLSLIKKTLPRPKDVAFPVDLFTRMEQGCPRVFHRKIVKPCGSYDVVAVYNLETERTLNEKLDLKSMGLDESRTYLLWEFWSCEYVGKVRGQWSAQVPPYSVKVYRLTEDMGRPTILGTDMHVLMGEMEIDRCDWDAGQRVLSGSAIRPVGERGSVFIYAPPKMGVANPKGNLLAQDKRDNSLIIRCPLQFEEGWANWRVEFRDL